MKYLVTILAAFVLVACGGGGGSKDKWPARWTAKACSAEAGYWRFCGKDENVPNPLPANADGGFELLMKAYSEGGAEPHYVMFNTPKAIEEYKSVSAEIILETVSGDPVFLGNDGTDTASFSLMIQRNGTKWDGKDEGRWWCRSPAKVKMQFDTPLKLSCDLVGGSVWRPWPGNYDSNTRTDLFDSTKARSNQIGITFGDTTGLGHGWAVNNGVARLKVKFNLE